MNKINEVHNLENKLPPINIPKKNIPEKIDSLMIPKNNERRRNSSVKLMEEKFDIQNKKMDNFKLDEEIEQERWGFKVLQNIFFIGILFFLTIYALFADYFRILFFNPNADIYFDILTILTIIFFGFEIFLSSITKLKYVNSFLFYLDVLSTIFLVLDITYLSESIFFYIDSFSTIPTTLKIAARAGRIIRVIKLFKTADNLKKNRNKKKDLNNNIEYKKQQTNFIASIKKYNTNIKKQISSNKNIENEEKNKNNQNNENFEIPIFKKNTLDNQMNNKSNLQKNETITVTKQKIIKESKVGKKLSELTIQRVIMLVLITLLIVPLFSANIFYHNKISLKGDIKIIKEMINNKININIFNNFIENLKNEYDKKGIYIIKLQVPKPYKSFEDKIIYDLRFDEILKSEINDYILIASNKFRTNINAILNLIRTVFVTFLLIIMGILFNKDARKLILDPIERMIYKVNLMALDPMIFKNKEFLNLENKNNDDTNETLEIEKSINKIGILLILGFGQAGTEIISTNLLEKEDIDPNIPGIYKYAIFGFCDIRNFTDITEILQNEVMVFVNKIAEIVHSVVDSYHGSANKNIGDAFLLIWRLPDEYSEDMKNEEIPEEAKKIANLSVLSFLKIMAQITKSQELYQYSKNPLILKRIPDYKVKMGFGLHVGWAIEGAIGSEYKIDASYLSPNVNMASRLEAATKQFGINLLISGDLVKMLTEEIFQICRKIDIVTFKGSNKPTEIYTVDVDLNKIKPDFSKIRRNRKKKTTFLKESYKKSAGNYFKGIYGPTGDFDIKDILILDDNFNEIFSQGFSNYIEGNWDKGITYFENCLDIRDDGPTKTLYNYIINHNKTPPLYWNGFRKLDEK